MYAPEHYLELKESSIIVSVALSIFVFLSAIFLANLLVVQFAHTYHAAHASMKERVGKLWYSVVLCPRCAWFEVVKKTLIRVIPWSPTMAF